MYNNACSITAVISEFCFNFLSFWQQNVLSPPTLKIHQAPP